jgi:hypothetical protein
MKEKYQPYCIQDFIEIKKVEDVRRQKLKPMFCIPSGVQVIDVKSPSHQVVHETQVSTIIIVCINM